MDDKFQQDVMRSLGRIEGELVGMRSLDDRISTLEQWQSWLKGGLAACGLVVAYVLRHIFYGTKA